MEREGPVPLRAIDDELRALGIDPTLPWLPESAQLDLLIPLRHPADPSGEDAAPLAG
jgi:hypothetical protein